MALREKASRLESELGRERELRSGAEKLAAELQTSLTRESERAEDLKVCSCFIVILLFTVPNPNLIQTKDPYQTYPDEGNVWDRPFKCVLHALTVQRSPKSWPKVG